MTSTAHRDEPIVLSDSDIDRLPTVRLPGIGLGVSQRVLWQEGADVVGVMRLRPSGRVDPHVHQHAAHDIWVHDGSCEVLGRYLRAGSFAHVPAGVTHDLVAGPGGCTVLYLYRRLEETS